MSYIQQYKDKKPPTMRYVLGIGALVGALLGPQNFLFDRGPGDPLIRYFLPGRWGLTVVIIEIVSAIAGAMIGQKMAKSVSGKWIWLWVGAMIGTWLPLLIVVIFWISIGGGY